MEFYAFYEDKSFCNNFANVIWGDVVLLQRNHGFLFILKQYYIWC